MLYFTLQPNMIQCHSSSLTKGQNQKKGSPLLVQHLKAFKCWRIPIAWDFPCRSFVFREASAFLPPDAPADSGRIGDGDMDEDYPI